MGWGITAVAPTKEGYKRIAPLNDDYLDVAYSPTLKLIMQKTLKHKLRNRNFNLLLLPLKK